MVSEIEIRGALGSRADDPNAAAAVEAAGRLTPERRCEVVTADRVLAELEACRAQGARAVLLDIDLAGGAAGAGWRIHDALRAFSAAGGRSVAFVHSAASAGIDVALGADVVVVAAPAGGTSTLPPGFLAHAALAPPHFGAEEVAQLRARVRAETLRRISGRVATPLPVLAAMLSVPETAEECVGAWLPPAEAVAHGWADLEGSREVAEEVAAMLAAGGVLVSRRAVALASGDWSGFECPAPRVSALPRLPYVSAPAAPAEAVAIAMGKGKATYAATPPASPSVDDLWFSTDTTTNCPDNNCRGHPSNGGVADVGTFPHRALYWPHRWNGTAWVDGGGQQTVLAAEIAAGAITAAKIAAGEIKTSNYAEDGSGNPTAGAKLDHTGTALKVAPGGLVSGASWRGSFGPGTTFTTSGATACTASQPDSQTLRLTFANAWPAAQYLFASTSDFVMTQAPYTRISNIQAICWQRTSTYVDFRFFDLTNHVWLTIGSLGNYQLTTEIGVFQLW